MHNDELCALPLDPVAGYVLSLVDGESSVETITDICGFAAEEVSAILGRLLRLGAIDLRLHTTN